MGQALDMVQEMTWWAEGQGPCPPEAHICCGSLGLLNSLNLRFSFCKTWILIILHQRGTGGWNGVRADTSMNSTPSRHCCCRRHFPLYCPVPFGPVGEGCLAERFPHVHINNLLKRKIISLLPLRTPYFEWCCLPDCIKYSLLPFLLTYHLKSNEKKNR